MTAPAATLAALIALAGAGQARCDAGLAAWRRGLGAEVRLWCGPGCGNCCTLAVNATLPEALAIAAVLNSAQRARLAAAVERLTVHARRCADARSFLAGYRQAVGPCPFLDDESNCTSYTVRPLACRALLATRPADWCGVNLAGLPPYERDAFLASLDRAVVAFPTHYAAAPQALAVELEHELLAAMRDLLGFSLSGNLLLLTSLAADDAGAAAFGQGPASLRALLAERGVDHPWLVQLDLFSSPGSGT